MIGAGNAAMHSKMLRLAILGVSVAALAPPLPVLARSVAPAPAMTAPVSFPVSPDVAAAYDTFRIQPIWTRHGLDETAVAQLASILKRAPFDGFSDGPELAAQVQQ